MNSSDFSSESPKLAEKLPLSIPKYFRPSYEDTLKESRLSEQIKRRSSDFKLDLSENRSLTTRKINFRLSKKSKKFRTSMFNVNVNDLKEVNCIKKSEKIKYLKFKSLAIANRLLSKFKKKMFYSNISNLPDIHTGIIGDKVFFPKESISYVTKLFQYSKGSILSKALMYLSRNIQIWSSKTSQFFNKIIPVYDANNSFKIVWDLILMGLTLVRIFTYSIEKCIFINLDIEALGFTLLILQILNIFVALNTNFYCDGEQITDRKKIFRNFVRNHMVTEVIPIVGLAFTYFSRSYSIMHDMNLVLVLRLANSGELGTRIKEFAIKNDRMESLYRLLILVIKIFVWGHLIACLWHFVGMKSAEGNPDGVNWLKAKGIDEKDWKTRYLYSIYWAVTTMLTVGYGDITPTNEQEMMFNIAAMFLGCAMFGYSMNSIGDILKFSGIEERLLKNHLKQVGNIIKDKNLPSETEIKIKKYMEFVWKQEQRNNPEQEKMLMNKLTTKLKEEIYLNTYVKLLKSVPALKNFSNKTLIEFSSFIKKVRYSPEEHVYKEGESDDLSVFFVINGSLQLVKEKDAKTRKTCVWKSYKKDDYFGINEFFTGKARSLAVVSLDFSTLFQLSRNDILSVLRKNPEELVFIFAGKKALIFLRKKEKFSRIKDLEILYENYDQYKISCCFCNRDDHSLDKCKFFAYKPPALMVVGKYLQRRRIKMKNFRRRPRKTENTLLYKKDCSIALNDLLNLYGEDDELQMLIKFYEELGQKEKESEKSIKELVSLDIKEDEEESSLKKEIKFEDLGSERKIHDPTLIASLECYKSSKSSRFSPTWISKIHRNPTSLESLSLRKSSFKQSTIKHELPHSKSTEHTISKKNIVDELMNFDKMKQFTFYFPRNNSKNIIFLLDRKSKVPYSE